MKKAFYALLAAALLFSLTGCGSSDTAKDAAKEEALLPPSSVRETGSDDSPQSSPALSETENPEATASAQSDATGSQAPFQAASSENQTAGAGSQAAAKPEATLPPAQAPSAKGEPPASEKPKPEPPPAAEPSAPEPNAPEESKPGAPDESEPEPSVPEEPKTPVFDIGYWISYGQSYGTGIGLVLDETTTACWDNPIRAGAHSKFLQSDISSTLDWYKASGFQYFWIWAESQGDGTYLYYIGYA